VLGSCAKSPVAVMALMVSGLVPLLVSVTDCAAAAGVPTTVLPKLRLEGASVTPGAVAAPVSAITCVPPLALSLIVTVPVRVPAAVGTKLTATVQLPPAATWFEVEQVVLGSSAKSPVAVMALMVSGLVPLLVSVTDCAAAAGVPTTVLPKLRLEGASVTPGPVAAFTVTVTAGVELLAASFAVPTKLAVMLSVPTGRVVVVSVATPLAFNCAAPMEVVPLAKVTVPLVTGVLPTTTVAVSVTLPPAVIVLDDGWASVVVVATALTVRLKLDSSVDSV